MTPQSANPSDALLARYPAGDCSPSEKIQVEEWLQRSAANRAALEELRIIWNTPTSGPHWDADAVWQNVRPGKSGRQIPSPVLSGRQPVSLLTMRRSSQRLWIGMAAAAAVIMAIAGIMQRTPFRIPAKRVAVSAPMREYVTRRGQMATIQLADGSQLVLAAESRLRISNDFGVSKRDLFLEGEAVFDVAHDAARPFRVYSKGAVAQDIGTRFDIRAYPSDSLVTVAVADGIVALSPQGQPSVESVARTAPTAEGILLRRGFVGTLGNGGRVSTVRDPFISRRFSWTDGRIQFTDRNLSEVVSDISRWYDVDVRVIDSDLSSRPVTASFSIQSVNEMVEALGLAVNARIERQGRVIILRKN